MPATKEQIRQIISENNITSVADVYTLLKDSFKDILQELMFEPKLIPKYQRNISGIEEKVISLYCTRDEHPGHP